MAESEAKRRRGGPKAHEVHGEWVLHGLFWRRGSYCGRVRHHATGKMRYFATRETDVKKAKNKLIAWIATLRAEAAASAAGEPSPTPRLFSTTFEEWLSTHDCRPVTLRGYWQDYQGFAPEEGEKTKHGKPRRAVGIYKPFFGDMLLSEITVADMQRFLRKLKNEGASRRTRSKHIGCLRSFFEWCTDMDYVAKKTPVRRKVLKIGKGSKKKNYALTHDEARALVAACGEKTIISVTGGGRCSGSTWDQGKDAPKYLKTAVLIALHTGLRRKNVLGLEWRHVDMGGAGRIAIPGPEMKAGEDHEIPIHPELAETLRDLLGRTRKVRPRARVLGERLDNISASLQSAWRRAKLPKHGAWHTLRHTFRTWLDSRATAAVGRDLLAHKAKDVDGEYIHAPWDERVRAIESLPRLLGKELEAARQGSG